MSQLYLTPYGTVFLFDFGQVRNVLKDKRHTRGEGVPTIACPTCDVVVAEWAIKRALPAAEYEALLNQSLQSFIDSGHDVSALLYNSPSLNDIMHCFFYSVRYSGAQIQRVVPLLNAFHTNTNHLKSHQMGPR